MSNFTNMSVKVKSTYGVVVMGLGLAGRARLRDLQKQFDHDILKKLQLKGFISRREIQDEKVPQLSLDESLSRDDIDLVIVATEPKLHEEMARRVLQAGKHCLVDYPVALSSSAAKDLFELARSKGVILHEENIGLISKTQHYLKTEIQNRPAISEAQVLLKGKYNGWLEKWEESGYPFTSANGLVQTTLSLFGDLKAISANLEQDSNHYLLQGHFLTANDCPVNITLHRVKDGEMRKMNYTMKFEDGSVIDDLPPAVTERPKPGEIGLFMQDLILCMEEIMGLRDPAERMTQTLKSLHLAETVHQLAGLN